MLDGITGGATYVPAKAAPGQLYWKLVKAEGPIEWEGKHSIYVDVLNEQGNREVGVQVYFWWDGGDQRKRAESKQGEPFACDLPMFAAGQAYSVKIDDVIPSDELHGMGLIAFEKHVSYKLTFQEVRADVAPVVVSPPPTTPQPQEGSKIVIQLDGAVTAVQINGMMVYQN